MVTVGRSDYSIYRPVLERIRADSDLVLKIVAAGSHLSHRFGLTAEAIEQDGFHISERVEMLATSDAPDGIARSMRPECTGPIGRHRPKSV